MAGLCAAIASARNGARTALIHDRPVLGGNASSEVRMWICGAHGKHNKEAGILEEIQLENLYHNPSRNYSLWDAVLWGKAHYQPNLTLFLNCSVTDARMDGDRIVSVEGWQSHAQTWHTVHARYFVDCSGDSILAATTPAEFRVGREARAEFDEDIEPREADRKTMGNTLLIQLRRTDEDQPYTPPTWAYKFTSPDDLPHRMRGVNGTNFWWIEVGGLCDTIRDAEAIRDELLRVAYGVWDYIKNYAPERAQAANWALEWVGALPGKRESRRLVGDHILTQNDVRDGGRFADTVAYGGWSMDDHHPAGIYYPGKPTLFHPAPSPYGIPFRCLYSRNVPNLLFAGRNISVTHAALSSTRVMGTCAILGQAVGTAAALCVARGGDPRSLSSGGGLRALQTALTDDDCWLPGVDRPISELARRAVLCGENGTGEHRLLSGLDRDRDDEAHAWVGSVGSGSVEYVWDEPVNVAGARVVFDSDLANEKRMPCAYPQSGTRRAAPASLVRAFRVQFHTGDGRWQTIHRETENRHRLVRVPVLRAVRALRLVPEATWGETAEARVFAFEPQTAAEFRHNVPQHPVGVAFSTVRAALPAADLAPPDNGLEDDSTRGHAA
jgi:hypothetical protein